MAFEDTDHAAAVAGLGKPPAALTSLVGRFAVVAVVAERRLGRWVVGRIVVEAVVGRLAVLGLAGGTVPEEEVVGAVAQRPAGDRRVLEAVVVAWLDCQWSSFDGGNPVVQVEG